MTQRANEINVDVLKKKREAVRSQATRLTKETDDILTAEEAPTNEKTLLTGEAESAIAGLQASGDCYSDAVDILRQRFENPEALVQDHMQGLIDVKPVFSARNVRALRGLYDEIQVHMRGLNALGIEDDGYQAMLYPILLHALPKELILDYHHSHAENQEEATPPVVDDSGSTTSSSDSSQLTPLPSLLRFFRFELESRERTLEDRPDDAHVASVSAAQRIKLPKLELTKFDGKRKTWQLFWEQFEVAVHKNTELSNIDRLNYLKTLLTGEAESAIAGLQASGDCYSDAVDILRQRFGHPEALVQDHMQGLIDVKPAFSARNVRALRGLYDEIQVHMLGLNALGIEDDGYQAMLYPILLHALPKELILDYHRSHAENQKEATPPVVDDSGSTTSSSDSSQLTPLPSLLRFFRFELESRERTLEDRPDDAHGHLQLIILHDSARSQAQWLDDASCEPAGKTTNRCPTPDLPPPPPPPPTAERRYDRRSRSYSDVARQGASN
ncbi:hypothetical protein V5799_025174 [Amblyomma americanum]|uniref:Uncharacterized protein n=1 Tax=Amblyomma americanum TaxID=6943 RepID=A0AAQ4EAB5_AMBAM